MQIFRVLGTTFLVISVLIVVVTAVPMLSAFGGGGFGGFGMMMALPSVLFTLVPIGIVFLVVANLLKALAGPSLDRFPGAVQATATVRSVTPSSVRVNGQPVLRIDLDLEIVGLPVVPVSVRRAVPREHLPLVSPGAVLPAMADPANPRRFAIDWARAGLASEPVPASELLGTAPVAMSAASGPASVAAGTGPEASVDVTGATLSALRATGVAGRGVIRAATDMGVAIGDGRLVRLRLDVIPDDRTGFPVEHVALVPDASRWRIVTGVTLPLFFDRTEPTRLAIDWSA